MAANLTPEQQQKVEDLKLAVKDTVQANPALQYFCRESTYLRYLVARNWNLHNATKMLKSTLEWRLAFKPHETKWAEIAKEAETGKQFRAKITDKHGRPVVIMRPRNENSKNVDGQIKYFVYTLEAACRAADSFGVGKMTWLIDFEGYSIRNAPALKVSTQTLSILQNHYPERLGCSVCFHPPTLFSMTWKAVQPFIDPTTKKKVVFVPADAAGQALMESLLDMDHVEAALGGRAKGDLFGFEEYAQQMQREDVVQEEAIRKLTANMPVDVSAGALQTIL